MSEEVELSRIDQTILRYADSESPEEISARFNGAITPERVAAQAKKLLADANWLTAAEQEELVIRRMRKIVADMEGAYQDLDTQKAQIAALESIAKRLDKRRENIQIDLETYDANVGREMARGYDIALGFMKGALRDEIDPEVWDSIAKDALIHAGQEVMKKAVEQ